MRRNFVVVVADLPDVGYFRVVSLPQQPGETSGIEQSVVPPVHGHHPEPECFLAHRRAKLR